VTGLAVLLGVGFALLCGFFAIKHSSRLRRVTLLDWALLGLGGGYGFGWALVVYVTRHGGNPTWDGWIEPFDSLYPFYSMCALLLLMGTGLGWMLINRHLRYRFTVFKSKARVLSVRRWEVASWFLLVLAVFAQWLYTRAYGGFLDLLAYTEMIRAAIFPFHNPLSFLRPFGGLAFIAAFSFFGLWLSGRRKLGIALGLSFSFLFSLYVLYSFLGRLGFMIFVVTFPLGWLLSRRMYPLATLKLVAVVFILILIGTYGVSVWLDIKRADDLSVFLAHELSFPFGSFFAQWHFKEHLLRGFRDFLFAPLYLLPSSWWTNWVEDVSQLNTALIMGAPKGEDGVTGGIPVDLITLGLMQLNVLGIPIVGMLFGALLRVLQHWLDRISLSGLRAMFEAYVALKIAVFGIFYAQPAQFVSGNFELIAGALVIVVFLRIPRIRFLDRVGTRQT
jgi:hypothetical protein